VNVQPFDNEGEPPVTVEWYAGERDALRPLFELAEDSAEELGSYLHAGRVLVARSGPQIAGHLQLTSTGQPGHAEVKNMAVREELQGQGVGRQLMQAALMLLAAEGVTTVRVATAAADIGNLRFYQRQGFRMSSVERDAFTEASGYPPGSQADGIALRDRVWLDIQLGSALSRGKPPDACVVCASRFLRFRWQDF
jgi:GNAT superfamily N-acetyltransferase